MTTYENAPATKMLATACACCGRPLVDAVSVETGVGPDCRKKHGYAEAQGPADWEGARQILTGGEAIPADLESAWGSNAHEVANVLTHRAACAAKMGRAVYIRALDALGYYKLARAIARASSEMVEVTEHAAGYAVRTPYRADFVEALKAARIGARWDREGKVWTFPADHRARAEAFRVMRASFAGGWLVSAKGLTQLTLARGRACAPATRGRSRGHEHAPKKKLPARVAILASGAKVSRSVNEVPTKGHHK